MTGFSNMNVAVVPPPASGRLATGVQAAFAGQPCDGAASTSAAENGAQKKSPEMRAG